MEIKLFFEQLSENQVILKTEDGSAIYWPATILPVDAEPGQWLFFKILTKPDAKPSQTTDAKDILNEILDIE